MSDDVQEGPATTVPTVSPEQCDHAGAPVGRCTKCCDCPPCTNERSFDHLHDSGWADAHGGHKDELLYRLHPSYRQGWDSAVAGAVDPERPADRTEWTVWRITAADADTLAGRELSDEELDVLARAIEHSSIPDALLEVVFTVAPNEDEDSSGSTTPEDRAR